MVGLKWLISDSTKVISLGNDPRVPVSLSPEKALEPRAGWKYFQSGSTVEAIDSK